MLRPRISRFSRTKPETCSSAPPRLSRAAASSWRSPLSIPEIRASDRLNCRTVVSFSASVCRNDWSFSAVPNSSSRLFDSVWLKRAEVLDRLVEGGALAAEVVRGHLEQVGEGALAVGAGRAERDVEVVEARVDLVELERHRGAVGAELGAVGEHGPAVVRRRELDEPVADDRRRDDHGAGVLGDLHVGVVGHRHLDVGARRGHLLDGADRDAEHAHVAAHEDRDGAGEVRDDRLALLAAEAGLKVTSAATSRPTTSAGTKNFLRPSITRPPGPAGGSGCTCRTTGRCRGCWRRRGRTAPSAAGCCRGCPRSCSAPPRRSRGAPAPA